MDSDEVWHFYEGDPLELLELDARAATLSRHRLGPVGDGDASPVHTIPAGAWQAARPLGAYTLVGCTVGPGFEFADFRLLADDPARAAAVRAALAEGGVARLTRRIALALAHPAPRPRAP